MRDLELSVISLRSAEERRRYMIRQLEAFKLPWSLFDALTGDARPIPYSEAEAAIDWRGPLTPGEIGCFASHHACLTEFVAQSSARYRLVIEDDVQLDSGFWFERLPGLMDAAGLDYLRLCAKFPFRHRVVAVFGQRFLVRYNSGPLGTQAYVISRHGAQQFLKSVNEITRPVDWELDRYWHNGLPPYTLCPFPLFEMERTSTVAKIRAVEFRATGMQRFHRQVRRNLERVRRETESLALRPRDRQVRKSVLAWWNS